MVGLLMQHDLKHGHKGTNNRRYSPRDVHQGRSRGTRPFSKGPHLPPAFFAHTSANAHVFRSHLPMPMCLLLTHLCQLPRLLERAQAEAYMLQAAPASLGLEVVQHSQSYQGRARWSLARAAWLKKGLRAHLLLALQGEALGVLCNAAPELLHELHTH